MGYYDDLTDGIHSTDTEISVVNGRVIVNTHKNERSNPFPILLIVAVIGIAISFAIEFTRPYWSIVYIAPKAGTHYHTSEDCDGLLTASYVSRLTYHQAAARHYAPCSICAKNAAASMKPNVKSALALSVVMFIPALFLSVAVVSVFSSCRYKSRLKKAIALAGDEESLFKGDGVYYYDRDHYYHTDQNCICIRARNGDISHGCSVNCAEYFLRKKPCPKCGKNPSLLYYNSKSFYEYNESFLHLRDISPLYKERGVYHLYSDCDHLKGKVDPIFYDTPYLGISNTCPFCIKRRAELIGMSKLPDSLIHDGKTKIYIDINGTLYHADPYCPELLTHSNPKDIAAASVNVAVSRHMRDCPVCNAYDAVQIWVSDDDEQTYHIDRRCAKLLQYNPKSIHSRPLEMAVRLKMQPCESCIKDIPTSYSPAPVPAPTPTHTPLLAPVPKTYENKKSSRRRSLKYFTLALVVFFILFALYQYVGGIYTAKKNTEHYSTVQGDINIPKTSLRIHTDRTYTDARAELRYEVYPASKDIMTMRVVNPEAWFYPYCSIEETITSLDVHTFSPVSYNLCFGLKNGTNLSTIRIETDDYYYTFEYDSNSSFDTYYISLTNEDTEMLEDMLTSDRLRFKIYFDGDGYIRFNATDMQREFFRDSYTVAKTLQDYAIR